MTDEAMAFFAACVTPSDPWPVFGQGGHQRPDGIFSTVWLKITPEQKSLVDAGLLYFDTTHNQNVLRFTEAGYDLARLLNV